MTRSSSISLVVSMALALIAIGAMAALTLIVLNDKNADPAVLVAFTGAIAGPSAALGALLSRPDNPPTVVQMTPHGPVTPVQAEPEGDDA